MSGPGRFHLALLIAVFGIAAVGAPAATAPAQDAGLLDPEHEAYLDARDRTVVLGSDSTYRPYVFFGADGELTGYTSDYVALLEERLDIRIEAREVSDFGAMLDAVRAREVDIVPNVVFSEERTEYLVFTEPFVTVVDRIIVRTTDTADYTLAELSGRTVAAVDGYAVTEFIEEQFPAIEVERVSSEVDGLRALSIGEVSALVADLGVVAYAVQEEGISNLRVAGSVDSISEQRFGVRSDEPILRDILDIGLASITEDEREAITDRWISLSEGDGSASTIVWIVGVAAFAAALAAAGALGWSWSLRRLVELRTEELRTELEEHERTERQRSRLEFAIEQAAEIVFVLDTAWSVRYVNPLGEETLGAGGGDLEDQPLESLVAAGGTAGGFEAVRSTVEREGVWRGRLELVGDGDEPVPLDGAIASVTLPTGAPVGFVGTLRDAREAEALQEELRHAEQLRAIGTLAAGIAHDFNNLLTPITGAAELLSGAVDDAERRVYLASIHDATDRASALVRQVRAYSLDQALEPEPVDLGLVVEESVGLIRGSCPPGVTVTARVASGMRPVLADPTRMHQLVMNLATNGVQAMAEAGGVLTITVAEEGERAVLTVADSGVGMDAGARERMFEPYFSTRRDAGGTGLGLFTVGGIVEAHDGTIEVESAPGSGTTVRVELPLTDRPGMPHRPSPVPVDPAGADPVHVVLVDDEASVRHVVESLLIRAGYEVTAFSTGEGALAWLEADVDVDVLITDVTMPGMRGDELARAAHVVRPSLPIVMLTGQFEIPDPDPSWLVASKPIRVAKLDSIIRMALDRGTLGER